MHAVNVCFPPGATRFRVTLQSVENGWHFGVVNGLAEAVFAPVSTGIVNGDECGCLAWRGVGTGTFGVATMDFVAQLCGKGKEKLLHRLLDTRGVSRGKAVQHRRSGWRAITAAARLVGAITFDGVCPMGAKQNAVPGTGDGSATHAESVALVKVFVFTSHSVRPGANLVELASGETTKSLFLGSDGL